jgi:hypothetical protein
MLRVSLFGDAYKKAQIDDGSIATLLKDELRNFLVYKYGFWTDYGLLAVWTKKRNPIITNKVSNR